MSKAAKVYESFMLSPEMNNAITKAHESLRRKHSEISISRSEAIRDLIKKGLKASKIALK